MNDNPLISRVEMESPTLPVLHVGAIFQWDGQSDVCYEEQAYTLPVSALPFPFQTNTNGQSSVLQIPPYLTTDEMRRVPRPSLRTIVWAHEASLLTFAFDPSLLVGMTDKRHPRVSGELVWTLGHAQPMSFIPTEHPILLVHAFHEVRPVHRIEIVLDLKEHDPLLQHMATVLQTAIEGKGMNGRFYFETLVDALAVHFLRRFGSTRHSLNNRPDGLSLYKLRRTIAYIKAHLAHELSLVTLAAVTKTSPAHFARMFKAATGLAPHQYVIRCRMEEAKRLLAETEDALSDISLQVGCADQSHFTALFHKHVGLTPRAYRDSIKR